MFKLTYQIFDRYLTESVQNNPIRWMCLRKEGPESFSNTTKFFKCKDYFNDFVAHNHLGEAGTMYGMCANQGKFDSNGGLWVLCAGIQKHFAENVDKIIHAEFGHTWGVKIGITPIDKAELPEEVRNLVSGGYALIYLPKEALISTYRISLITLFLRNCNVNTSFLNYDTFLDKNFADDGQLHEREYLLLKDRLYDIPEGRDYVWYLGKTYNSKKTLPKDDVGLCIEFIHGAGYKGTIAYCQYAQPKTKSTGKDPFMWRNSLPTYQIEHPKITHMADELNDLDYMEYEEEEEEF